MHHMKITGYEIRMLLNDNKIIILKKSDEYENHFSVSHYIRFQKYFLKNKIVSKILHKEYRQVRK